VALTLVRIDGVGGEVLVRARENAERLLVGAPFAGELGQNLIRAPARTGSGQRQREQLAQPGVGWKLLEAVRQRVVCEERRAALEERLARLAVGGGCLWRVGGCQTPYFGLAYGAAAL
jgi:hypothetical protein